MSVSPSKIIDFKVFHEIRELDDEEDPNFSKALVYDFFSLAEMTFIEMLVSL